MVQGQPRQIILETPTSKVTRAKWTGDVAQVVEYLPCKSVTLNSNPSPTKRKKKNKKGSSVHMASGWLILGVHRTRMKTPEKV
jgi:hypothetical protein